MKGEKSKRKIQTTKNQKQLTKEKGQGARRPVPYFTLVAPPFRFVY